jgi:hypothetical protein
MQATTPEDFLDALAHELRLRGVPVVSRWATAYQEQCRGQPSGAD